MKEHKIPAILFAAVIFFSMLNSAAADDVPLELASLLTEEERAYLASKTKLTVDNVSKTIPFSFTENGRPRDCPSTT